MIKKKEDHPIMAKIFNKGEPISFTNEIKHKITLRKFQYRPGLSDILSFTNRK